MTHVLVVGSGVAGLTAAIEASGHVDVTLVTNDTREFERVAGLRLENWAT